jgi:hypothetical protein
MNTEVVKCGHASARAPQHQGLVQQFGFERLVRDLRTSRYWMPIVTKRFARRAWARAATIRIGHGDYSPLAGTELISSPRALLSEV